MSNENKNRSKMESIVMGSKGFCVLLIILGIFCIFVTSLGLKQEADWYKRFGKDVLEAIGTTLLSIGILSFVLEISSIKKQLNMQ